MEAAGRWGIALFAVWGGFVGGTIGGWAWAEAWGVSGLEAVGFSAAFAVVGAAYAAAPAARVPYAAAILLLGALAAWDLLAPSGSRPLFALTSWEPLLSTWAGGVACLALCALESRTARRRVG